MALAKTLLLRTALLLAAIVMFGLDANDAFAQSRNCQALANTLQQIERNGSFAALGDITDQTRAAKDAVTAAESRYVRDGCNAAAKAGQPLNAQCRAEARTVLAARADLKKISSQADTGNAVAQQREAILQEMARFNCNSRASVANQPQQRGGLFDQLFGASRTISATAFRHAATSSRANRATTRSARCACARSTATTGRSAIRR